jgi:hypothetical protein
VLPVNDTLALLPRVIDADTEKTAVGGALVIVMVKVPIADRPLSSVTRSATIRVVGPSIAAALKDVVAPLARATHVVPL